MPRTIGQALSAVMLLWGDPCASLARTAALSSSNSKKRAPQRRKVAKPWRYSSPKDSKWDVRHTKSFRFELKLPHPSNNTTSSTYQSPSTDCYVLPMHKKPRESLSHVLGKGILWALFKDEYGSLSTQTILVETPIPEEPRYVPDVVAFQHPEPTESSLSPNDLLASLPTGTKPTFWGESGRMSADKAAALAWKYPDTHLVHFRWGCSPQNSLADFFEEIETAILPSLHFRTAPFEFAFLAGEPRNIIDEDGTVRIKKEDLQWRTAGFTIDPNY